MGLRHGHGRGESAEHEPVNGAEQVHGLEGASPNSFASNRKRALTAQLPKRAPEQERAARTRRSTGTAQTIGPVPATAVHLAYQASQAQWRQRATTLPLRRYTAPFLVHSAPASPASDDGFELVQVPSLGAADQPPADQGRRTGILVHGCHLSADGWEHIVWGRPPNELGRLPHAVLLAVEEQAAVMVFGTGASERDGLKESEYTLQYLWDHWAGLLEFEPLQWVSLVQAEALIRRIAVVDAVTQNTGEEVRRGLAVMKERHCYSAVLVSSPTHLPRCLACACAIVEQEPGLFEGPVYASPSDTCYDGFDAADVVVVEPPHRGDRRKSLDVFRFHELVRRTYSVPSEKKAEFLERFSALLDEYGA